MVAKIVTITLPGEIYERIENDRKNSSIATISRSEWIRSILVRYYKNKEEPEGLIRS